jgi:Kef-type K+ transport system membrane component KefB
MVLIMIVAALRRRLHVFDLPLSLCLLVFCYATFVYSLLNPDVRYANPFRPFEILLAVTFIARVHTYLRTRNQRSSVDAEDKTLSAVETDA